MIRIKTVCAYRLITNKLSSSLYRWVIVSLFGIALLISFGANATSEQQHKISFVAPGIAYHPLAFSPHDKKTTPTKNDLIRDLRTLHNTGFKSLVTYAANGILGSIPKLARQEGFKGTLIMGIWDPSSSEEWRNAIAQAPYVDGYCLGNEGLGIRYSQQLLGKRMNQLRKATGLPVTTSEPIDSYLKGANRDWLLANSDWIFPLAHPFWANQPKPKEAVDWIIARYDYLAANTGATVILKEAGVPTSGADDYSEPSQVSFFTALESAHLPFFYFEAFDQPWKGDTQKYHEVEAYWGIYHSDGTPKEIVPWLRGQFANE